MSFAQTMKFAGIGAAVMVFVTDLEIALVDLRKAFVRAKQRSDAAQKASDAELAKSGDPLAKAAALLRSLHVQNEADRESFAEIEKAMAAAKAAMPDFARHILGPQPRPRGIDPLEALRNGVTLNRFHRTQE